MQWREQTRRMQSGCSVMTAIRSNVVLHAGITEVQGPFQDAMGTRLLQVSLWTTSL